jgi:hypothetical protein
MLRDLDDKTLVAELVEDVRVERGVAARVLEKLVEVDRRRVWAVEGYSGLHDFCVRKLNYSDAEARLRVHSALCAKEIPEVLPMLARDTVCLTTVSLIAPHITPENAPMLLPQVEGKSTREVTAILRENFEAARAKPEWFNALLDEELKALLPEIKKELSENNPTELLKKAFKKLLARKTRTRKLPVKHTRYVPAAIKREVKAESGHQCSYKAASGVRCNQTARLQTDHVRPWGKGGGSWDKSNLRPMCKVHNLLLAKQEFPKWQISANSAKTKMVARGPRAREVHKQKAPPVAKRRADKPRMNTGGSKSAPARQGPAFPA